MGQLSDAPASRQPVVVLDGGLATELEARGHDLSDRLWSARVLMTDPDAIEDVHLDYFRAGARVATTASYQATVPGFEAAGLDRAAALAAIGRSVELARRARDRFADRVGRRRSDLLVAGSVGPYATVLADGSEYRGDYDPGAASFRDVHAPRIEALLAAGVDMLALETIPTLREAEVLVDLVEEFGRPPGFRISAAMVRAPPPASPSGRPSRWRRCAGRCCRRRELRLSAARPGAPRRGTKRITAARDRLPERRRHVGCSCPAVDRERR